MKITTENGFLVIRVPLKQDIFNPYSDSVEGQIDNCVGVISGDKLGIANYIDMSYKDKAPQLTPNFLNFWGDVEEFKALCKQLKIDIYEYPVCSKCHKPMYGSFTWKDGGEVCFECDKS